MQEAATSASSSAEGNAMQLLATATAEAAAATAASEKQKEEEDLKSSRMWDTRRPSQIVAMKDLVQEGVLSEESMAKAQEALEGHVANQVLSRQLQEKQERDKLAAHEDKLAIMRRKTDRKTYRQM